MNFDYYYFLIFIFIFVYLFFNLFFVFWWLSYIYIYNRFDLFYLFLNYLILNYLINNSNSDCLCIVCWVLSFNLLHLIVTYLITLFILLFNLLCDQITDIIYIYDIFSLNFGLIWYRICWHTSFLYFAAFPVHVNPYTPFTLCQTVVHWIKQIEKVVGSVIKNANCRLKSKRKLLALAPGALIESSDWRLWVVNSGQTGLRLINGPINNTPTERERKRERSGWVRQRGVGLCNHSHIECAATKL